MKFVPKGQCLLGRSCSVIDFTDQSYLFGSAILAKAAGAARLSMPPNVQRRHGEKLRLGAHGAQLVDGVEVELLYVAVASRVRLADEEEDPWRRVLDVLDLGQGDDQILLRSNEGQR